MNGGFGSTGCCSSSCWLRQSSAVNRTVNARAIARGVGEPSRASRAVRRRRAQRPLLRKTPMAPVRPFPSRPQLPFTFVSLYKSKRHLAQHGASDDDASLRRPSSLCPPSSRPSSLTVSSPAAHACLLAVAFRLVAISLDPPPFFLPPATSFADARCQPPRTYPAPPSIMPCTAVFQERRQGHP